MMWFNNITGGIIHLTTCIVTLPAIDTINIISKCKYLPYYQLFWYEMIHYYELLELIMWPSFTLLPICTIILRMITSNTTALLYYAVSLTTHYHVDMLYCASYLHYYLYDYQCHYCCALLYSALLLIHSAISTYYHPHFLLYSYV